MPDVRDQADVWLNAVLSRNRRPFWLTAEAPYGEVAVSSRSRILRNLKAVPVPGKCGRAQLEEIRRSVAGIVSLENRSMVSQAERDFLIGARLVSPEFDWDAPGRSLFLSSDRMVALMVNEEDHFRIQAITPGLSIETSAKVVRGVEAELARFFQFRRDAEGRFESADREFKGSTDRNSIMLHLAATAEAGSDSVNAILSQYKGLEVRGLLGEGSGGTGAFAQVSSTSMGPMELRAAVRVLIDTETHARRKLERQAVARRIEVVRRRALTNTGLSFEEATNMISWLRLGAMIGLFERSARDCDALLSLIAVRRRSQPEEDGLRARLFTRFLSQTLA